MKKILIEYNYIMGIGPQIISLYSDIYQDSEIRNNNSVCEIGRQNLVITKNVDDIFIKLFKLFNKQPSKDVMKLAPKIIGV